MTGKLFRSLCSAKNIKKTRRFEKIGLKALQLLMYSGGM
ncbi:hypothetical protein SAMN05428962_0740 [Paenibacillus sp. BC26]|nr:hypothetical protein SAMN05428962_0740 [Paenibacillus sp. BC26]